MPAGVEVVVVIVRMLEAPVLVGMIVAGLNEQDAPVGREAAMHDNVIGCPVPAVSVAFIVFVPALPLIAVRGPELDRE